jgi:thymidylate synthase
MATINEIYEVLLKRVYEHGMETAPRGMKVKELLAEKVLLDPHDNIITLPGLELNLNYAREELAWYYAATNRIDFSPLIQRIWAQYSDDGQHVNSAYGHRIFGGHELMPNQWEWVKQKLQEDQDSRQAVININQAFDKAESTKDFPCTVYCQVFIRDDKLHWITNMRSNDVFFGFRNDIYCFTEMQKRMAEELNIPVGEYIHFAGSMHLYEPQFPKVEALYETRETIQGNRNNTE